jgi:hypothetical protein
VKEKLRTRQVDHVEEGNSARNTLKTKTDLRSSAASENEEEHVVTQEEKLRRTCEFFAIPSGAPSVDDLKTLLMNAGLSVKGVCSLLSVLN